MENATQLAARVREVLLDGKWIANTNYQDQIAPLNWEQATRTIGPHNSIALLTFHINYYLAGIMQVFEGGELTIRDKFSFEMPPITSDAEWDRLRATFLANAAKFVAHVEAMSDAQLAAGFVKEEYGSYRRNIEGVIEHGYYHLGQMALLKKLYQI